MTMLNNVKRKSGQAVKRPPEYYDNGITAGVRWHPRLSGVLISTEILDIVFAGVKSRALLL